MSTLSDDARRIVDDLDIEWSQPNARKVFIGSARWLLDTGSIDEDVTEFLNNLIMAMKWELE